MVEPAKPFCSFCHKGYDDVAKMIVGESAYICNECVDVCARIVIPVEAEPEVTEQDRLASAAYSLNDLSEIIHARNVNAGWWTDLKTGEDLRGFKDGSTKFSDAKRDVLNLLCLVHSEISEACEGVRKNCPDDKLPHRSMFEVELADAFIRMFDIAGAHNLDLSGAMLEKLAFNANRADHKVENRVKDGGKAC